MRIQKETALIRDGCARLEGATNANRRPTRHRPGESGEARIVKAQLESALP
jgi:hypothetical protein